MAIVYSAINLDETSFQYKFYNEVCLKDVTISRSTDGFQDGTIFEHKINVMSFGMSKALSQALIYLTRFNQDGLPVPKNIALVSQNESCAYIFDSGDFVDIINNITEYSNMPASAGIPGFTTNKKPRVIPFDLTSAKGKKDITDFLAEDPSYTKVNINKHNVYGWSNYYYSHAKENKQRDKKKDFFDELRNPRKTLKKFIEPWDGEETDFELIMDMLNDPQAKKDLGAFYTPPLYAEKATELVREAIKIVPKGHDYIILDRCGGAGALENFLSDEELSHCILSTYELQEWIVLKEKYGERVRYIVPPIPDKENPDIMPGLNTYGYLSGANALDKDFIFNEEIQKYINDDRCTIILLENPPFRDITAQDKTDIKTKSYVYKEFVKAGTDQAAHRELDNLFIWSAFEYYLRQPTDSYILFSPVKYYKSLHLVNKVFEEGYLFNREHFHASANTIACIWWRNEEQETESIKLMRFDIKDNRLEACGLADIKKVHQTFKRFNDKRVCPGDQESDICVEGGTGLPSDKTAQKKSVYNPNIIGYLRATSYNLNPNSRCLTRTITRDALEQSYGFYLRSDNFEKYLPLFCAKLYAPTEWWKKDVFFTTGDKGDKYQSDKVFLKHCLLFTCLSQHNKCKHFVADGVEYRNELSLMTDYTIAAKRLVHLCGFEPLTAKETELIEGFRTIVSYAKNNCKEFNSNIIYGLRQLNDEINIKIVETKLDGKEKKVPKYGDLDSMIRDFKKNLSSYYYEIIVPSLFEYELLK